VGGYIMKLQITKDIEVNNTVVPKETEGEVLDILIDRTEIPTIAFLLEFEGYGIEWVGIEDIEDRF
jgi:hypothetical protein